MTTQDGAGTKRPVVLMSIEGQAEQVTPHLPVLGDGQVAVAESALTRMHLGVGDHIVLQQGQDAETQQDAVIAATFDDLPYRPEPAFWCGQRELLRPTAQGDPPSRTLMLAAPALLQHFETASSWEVRLASSSMSRDELREAGASFVAATEQYAAPFGVPPKALLQGRPIDPTVTVLSRAEALAAAVNKSIEPVRLVGILTAVVVLVASAVMYSRERHRELRLMALRGAPPWHLARRVLGPLALPVVIGTAVGVGLAVVGVRTFGPTSRVEPHSLSVAVVTAVAGLVAALVLVTSVTAMAGDRTVDSSTHQRRFRWMPWELPAVAVLVLSSRQLSRSGAVQMFGVQAAGGALLAQAFPQLVIATGVVLAARPLVAVLRRSRMAGRRLPGALRLGIRRVVIEPPVTTAMFLAVTLASGSFLLAGILSSSAERQLVDKSSVFVGADMSLNLAAPIDVPPSLQGRASIVRRRSVEVEAADTARTDADVLGIDPDTFAEVAAWRGDAATRPLAALVEAIRWPGGDAPVTALAVGSGNVATGERVVMHWGGDTVELTATAVGSADWFPGYQHGTPLLVVDSSSIEAADPMVPAAIWVHDPPIDTPAIVTAAGGKVSSTQRSAEVFDGLAYSAQRWSYSALGAYGVLVACTMLTLQLLVVDARRDTRRLTHLVLSRMRTSSRALWASAVVEVGVPLTAGAIFGVVLAWAAGHWSVGRLDPLPGLEPPSIVVVPWPSVAAIAAATLVCIAIVATMTVRSTLGADPMEVSRGSA